MKTVTDIATIVTKYVNPENIPSFVKPVCIVSGNYYDMGRQFGQQMKDNLYTSILHLSTRIITGRGDKNVMRDAYRYEEVLRNQSPEVVEMFQGTADAIGLPYEAILIYAIPNLLAPSPNACSTISAWGRATEKGALYCAANADGGAFTPTSYGPTMVLYPEQGNVCICNGGYNSNLALNSKGLVTMASNGGWNGKANDIGYGTSAVLSPMQISLKCNDAEEAIYTFTKVNAPIGAAENFHCVDIHGKGGIIEATFGHSHIRRSGEFGEVDYMLATNYFLSDEMQDSKPENDINNINSPYRYQTEEQLLKDNHGKIDLSILDDILSCRDYYDGSSWVKEVWDEEYSRWSPEKRSAKNSTYMQCFADPENLTVYFRQGERCITCSNIPGTTGGLSKFVLKNTPEAMVEEALIEAKRKLYTYSGKIELGMIERNCDVLNRLDEAKKSIWIGDNYKAMGYSQVVDIDKKLFYISKAVTAFAKAQALLDTRFTR